MDTIANITTAIAHLQEQYASELADWNQQDQDEHGDYEDCYNAGWLDGGVQALKALQRDIEKGQA